MLSELNILKYRNLYTLYFSTIAFVSDHIISMTEIVCIKLEANTKAFITFAVTKHTLRAV